MLSSKILAALLTCAVTGLCFTALVEGGSIDVEWGFGRIRVESASQQK